jgi:hypothetical protein
MLESKEEVNNFSSKIAIWNNLGKIEEGVDLYNANIEAHSGISNIRELFVKDAEEILKQF